MGAAELGLDPPEVHVLLLDDLLLLLQRQDERLLLKSHSRTLTPTPDGKTMLRPVLRLTSAMTREVATGEARPGAQGAEGALGAGPHSLVQGRLGGLEAAMGRPLARHIQRARLGCGSIR